MTREVNVGAFTVLCDDPYEVWRAETFFEKEPGTIAWLDTIEPGDVVFDIGANIGLYSLYAAQKVGPTGRVFAFEPHLLNAWKLLQNVQRNALDRVTVVTAPLSVQGGIEVFHYRSVRAGSSGSQLGTTMGEDGKVFAPALQEYKMSTTIGAFILETGCSPDMVKIDVDGRERDILLGWPLLSGALTSPRSLQVEVHPRDAEAIAAYFTQQGYMPARSHFTQNGQTSIAKGADPASVTCNTIFERAMVPA